jgi:predicted short-subunit dehydrogenase-like oxidoreductase (DUF2520 family)
MAEKGHRFCGVKHLENRRLVIIGAGVVGRALGKGLREAGVPVAAVVSRSASRARSAVRFIGEGEPTTDLARAAAGNLVMLATIDRVLGEKAERVAASAKFAPGTVAFHCSGAFAGDAIGALRAAGAAVGSLHPMQTFASPEEGMLLLPGSSFAVEGDRRVLPVLDAVARAVGGKPVRVAARDKALYHAAAAITSNSAVAIAHLGTTMLAAVPSFKKDPFSPLRSLLRGTLRNLERLGPEAALTGPIVRGDVHTVAAHIAALRSGAPQLLSAYRVAANVTLEAALASGRLDAKTGAAIRRVVEADS